MAEALTLGTVATTVINEGIRFLYGQATEILKIWRARKNSVNISEKENVVSTDLGNNEAQVSKIFEGNLLLPLKIDLKSISELEEQLCELIKDLSEYAEGIEELDLSNTVLLEKVDALRKVLEAICQQRLTFRGEQRKISGPIVEGDIIVNEVRGYAAAVSAKEITSGQVTGKSQAKTVEVDGKLFGIVADNIGS